MKYTSSGGWRVPVAGLFAAAALAAGAADPYVGYIYPAGIEPGATNRFVVGGQDLRQVKGAFFSGGGLRVLSVEAVPNFPNPEGHQRKHLMKWLDGIAAGDLAEPEIPADANVSEWTSNEWWKVLGTLDAGKLAIVARDLYTPRNALQASPSLRQLELVTIAADVDAEPGVRSLSLYGPGGVSAPRPFLVVAAPRRAEPLYEPPARRTADTNVVDVAAGAAVLDGQIMPGETDSFRLRLAGDRRYAIAVTARELQPYIGDAVPGFFNPCVTVRGADGAELAFADDADRFRPDPVLDFTPPADGVYTLEVRDVLFRGRADFVYQVEVDDWREAPPPAADGVVSAPGAVCQWRFMATEPGPVEFEVEARRLGSPLDAVVTLRRAGEERPLARWDDVTNTVLVGTVPQAECDPAGVYDIRRTGEYVVEISDRTGHGGPDYFWKLRVGRPRPRFEVYSTRSTLPLTNLRQLPVTFKVVRAGGFEGPVRLEFPADVAADTNVVAAGSDTLTAKLKFRGRRAVELCGTNLFAVAEIGGAEVRRAVVPCDEYEQAFAWRHLVPAGRFLFRGRVEQPTFKNPVIAEDWPDPTVYDGGDGWCYTVATQLKTVRRSRNLVDWKDMKRDPLTADARRRLLEISGNIWAPSVVKIGKRWMMYVSLFISDPDCRIAVLGADGPAGPFEFLGEVVQSRREGVENAIDPYVFVADGRVWMFFGSLADGIHRVELTADGLAVKPGAKPEHVAGVRHPASKMEHAWEGSYLLNRHGWWYLFLSGGNFADHTYYLTVGRSRAVDGVFVDREGHPLTEGLAKPILESRAGDRFLGPGHNGDVFRAADGRDWIFYHSHDATRPANERPTLLQELRWDKDKWPVFEGGRPKPVERRPKYPR